MKHNLGYLILLIAIYSCTQKKDVRETIVDSAKTLKLTPEMAQEMKATLIKKLVGTDFEKTQDVDRFCDCTVDAIGKEFSVQEMKQKDFKQTKKYRQIVNDCMEKTHK